MELTARDASPQGLIGIISAFKSASVVCISVLADRDCIDLDVTMPTYLSEFTAGGKPHVLVRAALSNEADPCGVEPQFTLEQLVDHVDLSQRLADMRPHWLPGMAHGYHGTTIGTLLEELVRRVDGRRLPQFFAEEIARLWGIDVTWRPTTKLKSGFFRCRYTRVRAPRVRHLDQRTVLPVFPSITPLTGKNCDGHGYRTRIRASCKIVRSRKRGFGARTSAARVTIIGEVDAMPPTISEHTCAQMSPAQSFGFDLVLGMLTRCAAVFEKSDDHIRLGRHQVFGHDLWAA